MHRKGICKCCAANLLAITVAVSFCRAAKCWQDVCPLRRFVRACTVTTTREHSLLRVKIESFVTPDVTRPNNLVAAETELSRGAPEEIRTPDPQIRSKFLPAVTE